MAEKTAIYAEVVAERTAVYAEEARKVAERHIEIAMQHWRTRSASNLSSEAKALSIFIATLACHN